MKPLPSPPYHPSVGTFQIGPCGLCQRDMTAPVVRPGETVRAALSYLDGWGLMHTACSAVLVEGRAQGRMELKETQPA